MGGKSEKRMRRRVLERLLRAMAQAVLLRYHPIIVGVTGSVGKSSTKEAIARVLSTKFPLRKSEGNYNNEIGAPLTIIGAEGGGGSFLRWFLVGFHFLRLVFLPSRYPSVLVLEMGIDRPSDMEYLLSFIPVKIGVVTRIGTSHIEYFGSVGNIAREKSRIISELPEDGFAVLNADDERVFRMREKTKAFVITYGFSEHADVRADNLLFHSLSPEASGWSFKLNHKGKTIPVRLPHVLAKHHIEDALAGAAVGIALGMNLVEIASALEGIEPLPGRLRLLPGRNGSVILDDTYNASPISMNAALEAFRDIPAMRKIAVLGDMLELGSESETSHRDIAKSIRASGAEIFVAVGKKIRLTRTALIEGGFPERQTFFFPDPVSAGEMLCEMIKEGDLVLLKGSRGMRMEKISEMLLANPETARNVLCSQSDAWRLKPFSPPTEWEEGMNGK